MRWVTLIVLVLAAALVAAVAVDRLGGNGPIGDPAAYPRLVAIQSISAGTPGERILRLGYVRVEIGGGRTADPSYLLERREYRYLRDGVAIVDIRPGEVLQYSDFRRP